MEVSQVAESIAFKLNNEHEYFQQNPINTRICATAGLVHDMGHPPFGHNGEHALDDKMRKYGGFEGNAQTFRILTRLEKKRRHPEGPIASANPLDQRAGLNLSYRTLAAALKYDNEIEHVRGKAGSIVKGYYSDDAKVVNQVKSAVEPEWEKSGREFKTVECAIMDIADDIAYSTYDLEDSLKAQFLTPVEILNSDPSLLDKVADKVSKAVGKPFTGEDALGVFLDIFSGIFDTEVGLEPLYSDIRAYDRSTKLASDGYLRTDFTAQLVGEFIDGVQVDFNKEFPSLSSIHLEDHVKQKVETLKNYTFEATIFSTRLKVAEFRGYEVVSKIFDAVSDEKGYLLMPDDVRLLYGLFESNASARMRVVCDFIAGMTDRYALEFYGRLHSDTPQSIFKPI